MKSFFASLILVGLAGCSGSNFRASGGGDSPHEGSPVAPGGIGGGEAIAAPPGATTGGGNGGIDISSGSNVIPDYRACAALPQSGKQKYPQKCGGNTALVIVNDGGTQEMTCCPINVDIFSISPYETHVEREVRCQADEIGVGMLRSGRSDLFSVGTSKIYCSKIDTKRFYVGTPQLAQYVDSDASLSPDLRAIASSYNGNDTCVCPRNTIMIGGHMPQNGICTDQCVEILRK